MSDQDLFNDKDKGNEVTPVTLPTNSPSTDYTNMLGMIVNSEGKPKYATIDEALKGAVHAQAHISKLEQELADARKSQESAKKIEDVISTLQSRNNTDQSGSDKSLVKSVTPTDIQDIVKNVITDINTKATQDTNIKTVTSKFKELYGEKASETLYGKANDLGMSREDINSLIAKNPQAALRVLGVDTKTKPNTNLDKGSVNTETFKSQDKTSPKSAMGYTSTKELQGLWEQSKQRTLERLNAQN